MSTKFTPNPHVAKLEAELEQAFAAKNLEEVNRLSALIIGLKKEDQERAKWFEESRSNVAMHIETIRSAITAQDLREALEGALIAFGFHHEKDQKGAKKTARKSSKSATKGIYGKVGDAFYELVGGKAREIAAKRGRIKVYASIAEFEKP